MLSLVPRRYARRALTAAALALALSAALAPTAPAAVRANALISVTGNHRFGALGSYAVSGRASITSMQIPIDPCRPVLPGDPCRVLTIATVARATSGPITCLVTGATTTTVPVTDTTTVDAIVTPSSSPAQPTDPCTPLGAFAIRYRLTITPDNTIADAVAQTEPIT
jgi:hypothetical protein